ncbi:MAG TPA: A/G-specific adenine glycosylase [Candidatus Limnocylindrales bacterium]|nr:A/G-specific adenine glycosylase [Candidatus Limnocylindrales bacterium]
MRRRHAVERALFAWFDAHGRTLDVREAETPWEILVLEVMSQQTQIDRVGPYWRAFVGRWPTPAALAGASTHDLLGAWAGLGYNRRALALREAARVIARDHGGEVPDDPAVLTALPGIGPYTARAVAATAFGRPVAPVDVNVGRVVRRIAGIDRGRPAIQAAADDLISRDDPRRWVSAVMDLAATICTRREPRCGDCPVADWCASRGTAGDAPDATPNSGRFESTNRWLRGRIVARLREAAPGAWVTFRRPIGPHPADRVAAALVALAGEGFLELDGSRARIR